MRSEDAVSIESKLMMGRVDLKQAPSHPRKAKGVIRRCDTRIAGSMHAFETCCIKSSKGGTLKWSWHRNQAHP